MTVSRNTLDLLWITQLGFAVSLAVTVLAAQGPTAVPPRQSPVMIYAGVGSQVAWYSTALEGTVAKRGEVAVPANVNEGAVHPSGRFLYVAWSDGGPSYEFPGSGFRRTAGTKHGVSAFRIDPASGALHAHGAAVSVPARPIHMTLDAAATHALVAQNEPSALTVIKINADGTLGHPVAPASPIDAGVYAHGVGVDPAGKMVVLAARGNGPRRTDPKIPVP